MIDLEQEIAEIRAALTEISVRLEVLEVLEKRRQHFEHDDVFHAPQAEYLRAAESLPAS